MSRVNTLDTRSVQSANKRVFDRGGRHRRAWRQVYGSFLIFYGVGGNIIIINLSFQSTMIFLESPDWPLRTSSKWPIRRQETHTSQSGGRIRAPRALIFAADSSHPRRISLEETPRPTGDAEARHTGVDLGARPPRHVSGLVSNRSFSTNQNVPFQSKRKGVPGTLRKQTTSPCTAARRTAVRRARRDRGARARGALSTALGRAPTAAVRRAPTVALSRGRTSRDTGQCARRKIARAGDLTRGART